MHVPRHTILYFIPTHTDVCEPYMQTTLPIRCSCLFACLFVCLWSDVVWDLSCDSIIIVARNFHLSSNSFFRIVLSPTRVTCAPSHTLFIWVDLSWFRWQISPFIFAMAEKKMKLKKWDGVCKATIKQLNILVVAAAATISSERVYLSSCYVKTR